MKWFGESWGAPICTTTEQTTLPEVPCVCCDQPFVEGDQGFVLPYLTDELRSLTLISEDGPCVAYHRKCLLGSMGVTA
jgi:hypothetical protein